MNYPQRTNLLQQLINERAKFVSTTIQCDTPELAGRLKEWLGRNRPEFEDELLDGEEEWFRTMDIWPYAEVTVIRGKTIFANWMEKGMKGIYLRALGNLPHIEVTVIYLIPEYAGWGDGVEYDNEDEELGFYIVNSKGKYVLLPQSLSILPSGYELQYDRNSGRDLEELCLHRSKLIELIN